MYKLVIFDLDGTLLNTIDDIKDSINFALEKHGLPKYSIEQVKRFVGSGVKQMVERALNGLSNESSLIQTITKDFMEKYKLIQKNKTKPYPNIVETLNKIKNENIYISVLSNKPIADTKNIISYYFDNNMFDLVYGQIDGIPVKPDSALVNRIINSFFLKKEEVLFVGDSDVDMMTAKNAGIDSVFVSWGFRTYDDIKGIGVNYIITDPLELLNIVK
ncbi:MAG: HAD family hydrolase [Bacilli bacterium]|jgi:phosphoglycolate phosphatase|nr:HAD family hydrolase [Bacilli bacterium]MDD2681947.1 HAD family hydrolase [Bacilli bacterium]MDD3121772.1 HAD family hydrolase [Bacilli bacterium]MDD4063475.1 HAD family hydrolase [Bacilli bacterium]MDD4481969.1 HAD family hydrolase [Bacilli bacterium]